MRCKKCNHPRMDTIETRGPYRRRRCPDCGNEVETREIILSEPRPRWIKESVTRLEIEKLMEIYETGERGVAEIAWHVFGVRPAKPKGQQPPTWTRVRKLVRAIGGFADDSQLVVHIRPDVVNKVLEDLRW